MVHVSSGDVGNPYTRSRPPSTAQSASQLARAAGRSIPHMFLDRTTEPESGAQTRPNQRFRWLHSVPDTTLSLAVALAVMTSVQPLLFSMLHAWVSPKGALPLPPDAFAASALASLGAAALAVFAVRVISPRLGHGPAPPPQERKVLSELLADLSEQTTE